MMTPKNTGFTMPAEWHPHSGCWMAWPKPHASWETVGLQKAREAYAQVARAIAKHEPVTMLVNPDEIDNAIFLCGNTIDIRPLAINDSWTRDTGPTFLTNAKGELAGVQWIHNAWGGNYTDCELDKKIAETILNDTHAKRFKAPLVMEGGERLTLSYVNFYLANGGIVMPAFGHKTYDQKAYESIRTLFPKHQVTQLPALNIFAGGGGIHCITQQQPLPILPGDIFR